MKCKEKAEELFQIKEGWREMTTKCTMWSELVPIILGGKNAVNVIIGSIDKIELLTAVWQKCCCIWLFPCGYNREYPYS